MVDAVDGGQVVVEQVPVEQGGASISATDPNGLLAEDGGAPAVVDSDGLLATDEGESAPEPAVVPESYEIAPYDGYEILPEIMETVTPLLKKYNLSQEGAQELANAHMDIMQKQAAAAEQYRQELLAGWVKEIKTDPEFGGAKFKENMALARRGLAAMQPSDGGKSKLNEFLADSGIDKHPEIIKAFARVGRLVKEDSVLDKGKVSGAKGDYNARDMFSKTLDALGI